MKILLIVVGGGLYTPNLISEYGKSYLNKTKLLDSGFTLFYLAMNLGSFLGTLFIAYCGEEYGFITGFILAGVVSLLSLIPILNLREQKEYESPASRLPKAKKLSYISLILFMVALFWGAYELTDFRFFELQSTFAELFRLSIPPSLWLTFDSLILLPISLIALIVWTYRYSSQFVKLFFGFVFGLGALALLYFVPRVPTEQDAGIYILSLVFFVIAETFIAPIIHSTLTKYSNPQYLAILMSLVFIPMRLFPLLFGLLDITFYRDNSILGLHVGLMGMGVVAIGLFVLLWNKKTTVSRKNVE